MAVLIAFLLGCGTVSNAIFTEDADFLAVLPLSADHLLDLPGSDLPTTKGDTAERPELLAAALTQSNALNALLLDVLATTDAAGGSAPTDRTADSRVWGPYTAGSLDLLAEVTRAGASRFDWAVADARGESDLPLLAGTHYAGETVATGDGTFRWDQAVWGALVGVEAEGSLTLTCDHRAGLAMGIDLAGFTSSGAPPGDGTLSYALTDASGEFQFVALVEVPGGASGESGTGPIRTRWTPDGGRADVLLTSGDLGDAPFSWSQCWDAAMTLTYQSDSGGRTEPVGAEIDCVYGSFGL